MRALPEGSFFRLGLAPFYRDGRLQAWVGLSLGKAFRTVGSPREPHFDKCGNGRQIGE